MYAIALFNADAQVVCELTFPYTFGEFDTEYFRVSQHDGGIVKDILIPLQAAIRKLLTEGYEPIIKLEQSITDTSKNVYLWHLMQVVDLLVEYPETLFYIEDPGYDELAEGLSRLRAITQEQSLAIVDSAWPTSHTAVECTSIQVGA